MYRVKAGEERSILKREDWKAVFVIIIFYGCLQLVGITCPIRYVTGISCAGCGMTRAWLSLLRMDFSQVVYYHPLFWLPIPTAALYYFHRKIPKKWYHLGLCAVAALFLIVYIMRMMDSQDVIVVFRPSEGLMWRTAKKVFSMGNIL